MCRGYKEQGVTHDTRNSLVVALVQGVTLHIGAFLVVIDTSELVSHARWNRGDALQWPVSFDSILDVFPRCGPQCLFVRVLHSSNRAVLLVPVARKTSCIVRSFVVVARHSGLIEAVDDVGALEVLFPEMVSTVRSFGLLADCVQGRALAVVQRCSSAPSRYVL